ncbi:hypothetical protein CDD83_7246 [Cordyceps sp. RAO-2017]|nr:hypothetical protein CDD83_7246 [Cordyceps sp. RAO-2017]
MDQPSSPAGRRGRTRGHNGQHSSVSDRRKSPARGSFATGNQARESLRDSCASSTGPESRNYPSAVSASSAESGIRSSASSSSLPRPACLALGVGTRLENRRCNSKAMAQETGSRGSGRLDRGSRRRACLTQSTGRDEGRKEEDKRPAAAACQPPARGPDGREETSRGNGGRNASDGRSLHATKEAGLSRRRARRLRSSVS